MNKEWHEFYIKNKHRFTDSKVKAMINKDLIYIENAESPAQSLDYRNMEERMEFGQFGGKSDSYYD